MGMHKLKTGHVVGSLIVALVMLAMSGACSQHEPGPWEGGGRTTTTPQAPASTAPNDSGPPPDVKPPTDVAVDTFTGG
jgi:hypothetical protein